MGYAHAMGKARIHAGLTSIDIDRS